MWLEHMCTTIQINPPLLHVLIMASTTVSIRCCLLAATKASYVAQSTSVLPRIEEMLIRGQDFGIGGVFNRALLATRFGRPVFSEGLKQAFRCSAHIHDLLYCAAHLV